MENPCTFLLAKEKTWNCIFNTNKGLSQNHTEKQIMPSKTTVNWLFHDAFYCVFLVFPNLICFACIDKQRVISNWKKICFICFDKNKRKKLSFSGKMVFVKDLFYFRNLINFYFKKLRGQLACQIRQSYFLLRTVFIFKLVKSK